VVRQAHDASSGQALVDDRDRDSGNELSGGPDRLHGLVVTGRCEEA
jgi:hypothetical protein